MDVWTAVDNSFPCQISITDLVTRLVTTWAFDGFTNTIPVLAQGQCSAPKLMCAQENWLCRPKPEATLDQLVAALGWVCNPDHLDCTPIQPGGEFYIPNTPRDHSNWAFNAYYRLNRPNQGIAACSFGGIGNVIPPTSHAGYLVQTNSISNTNFTMGAKLSPVYSHNIVCDRT